MLDWSFVAVSIAFLVLGGAIGYAFGYYAGLNESSHRMTAAARGEEP